MLNLHEKKRKNHQKYFKNANINFYLIQSRSLLIFMEYQARTSNKPPHYAKIPLSKRVDLIQFIENEKLSIAKASKKLNIKLSTAKLILKKYREDGTFFQKRSDRLARLAEIKKNQLEPQATIQLPPPEPIARPPYFPNPNGFYQMPVGNFFGIGSPALISAGEMHGSIIYPWNELSNDFLSPQYACFYY